MACTVIPKNLQRLQKELAELKGGTASLRNLQVDESDISVWNGVLYPSNPPYNKGAFKVKLSFPADYPFKPPTIQFITSIYHPNVDEQGEVCLTIINPEEWKPTTRATAVVEALARLIEVPEPDHPLRADLAELFLKDKKKFLKNAEEFTRKHSEKRSN